MLRSIGLAAIAALALLPLSATAEPQAVRLSPAPGEVLAGLPATVDGWFSEGLHADPRLTSIQVYELQTGGASRRVDLGRPGVDLNDPTHISAEIEKSGRLGVFYVLWKATSARDGKSTASCSVFFVGNDALARAQRAGIGINCGGIQGIPSDSSPTPTVTTSPIPTASPLPTATPTPSASPTPTASPTPSASPTPTASPTRTASPAASARPSVTATPVPGAVADSGGGGGLPIGLVVVLGGLGAALVIVGLLAGINMSRRPPSGGGSSGGGPRTRGPFPRTRGPLGRPPSRPPIDDDGGQ